jgi:4-hydroxy-tetrahydrodipicolinate reductase
MIKVYVSGAGGKMGRVLCATVLKQADMELVGAADVFFAGQSLESVLGGGVPPLTVDAAPTVEVLKQSGAQVMIDFTNPQSVLTNGKEAILAGVTPVIGSTGLDAEALQELEELSRRQSVGVFIAPNFALGAVLMMKFAQQAAVYFQDVEIIELHHDQKLDAPSGTAVKTAEWIAKNRTAHQQGHPEEKEKITGARGAGYEGLRIHSVRLPGLEGHQEVIFGGLGQTLTIRHDAYSRESYMPGIMLAVRRAAELKDFVVGLENFLD